MLIRKDVMLFFALICFTITLGCAPHIPKSPQPSETNRTFDASFDRTWNAVLEIATSSGSTMVYDDKSLGLIVYRILHNDSKTPIYFNVCIRNGKASNETIVYLTSHTKFGRCLLSVEGDFFAKIERTLKRL